MAMKDPMPPQNYPTGKMSGPAKRPTKSVQYQCMSPDGELHVIDASCIRDWQSRPGHVVIGPVLKKAPAAAAEELVPGPEAPPVTVSQAKEMAERDPGVSEKVKELHALRKQAEDLGIEVDQRWGLKTLHDKIAQANVGLSSD